MATGYEPLNKLKPVDRDIWVVDGPAIRFYGMPFSTRMTVVRLTSGAIWLHSPTHLTEKLADEVAGLGPVTHLIAPNWIHYAYIADWQARFPKARAWAAPGVRKRAAGRKSGARFGDDLASDPPLDWAVDIDQMIVDGSRFHSRWIGLWISTR